MLQLRVTQIEYDAQVICQAVLLPSICCPICLRIAKAA